MNDTEQYLEFLKERSPITLGTIMNTHWAAEYRKHHSLIRDMGHQVICKRNGKMPSLNTYTFIERKPAMAPIRVEWEGEQATIAFG